MIHFLVRKSTRPTTVAKVLAARRIWARVMREEFGAAQGEPLMPRFRFVVGRAQEWTADDVETAARELLARIERMGGAVCVAELGFPRSEIGRGAARRVRGAVALSPDVALEVGQAERLAKLRAWRDRNRLDGFLARLRAAGGDTNVLYPMKSAGATVGEVCGVLGEVWGWRLRGDGG